MSETESISQMHARVDAFEKKLDEQRQRFEQRKSLVTQSQQGYSEIKQAKHELKQRLALKPGVDWEELKLEFERDMAILETRFDHWTRYNDLHFERGKR
jgi:hypothetical protein